MKVLIVGFHPRGHVPYVAYYEEILKEKSIKYDCIFWDRFSNGDTEKNDNEYTLHIACTLGGNRFKKILPMIKYYFEVKKILDSGDYTHIVILSTLPAVLLSRQLLSSYKSKYILDIRDYTYEKYKFYKNIVKNLINNSFFTCISSKGFLQFLEKSPKIVFCHNITNQNDEIKNCECLKDKNKIVIGFVGGIRYFNENTKLITSLDNNKFYFKYIGRCHIDCDLESYCIKNKINNVEFQGIFDNSEKPNIYKNIDIINSIYGNYSLEVTTAVPNRLYDTLLFKKPIIVSKGTYLAEIVGEYKLGIIIDVHKDNVNDILIKYIKEFDNIAFEENVNILLQKIKLEQNIFQKKINDFFNIN
ncbi:MAG: hypothetical protein Q4E98_01820 [Acidaminococcaceae bacterium]|nr:hypothetical protein [Acidaminococcaceae bacterium]